MESSDIVGLLIGIVAVAALFGTLADVYLHPDRFGWLELPPPESGPGRLVVRPGLFLGEGRAAFNEG